MSERAQRAYEALHKAECELEYVAGADYSIVGGMLYAARRLAVPPIESSSEVPDSS